MSGNVQTLQPPLTEASSRCCERERGSRRAMPISDDELVVTREGKPQVSNLSLPGHASTPLQQSSAHDPALQSININSALDRYSSLIDGLAAKSATEPFNLSGHKEKENCPSPPHPEEYSTSFTAGSKSPTTREDTQGFVVWSNAMFCLEACDFTSCNSEDRNFDPFTLKSTLPTGFDRSSLSTSASAVAGSSPPVHSEEIIGEDDQHLSHESSVGSTLYAHDRQAQLWKKISTKGPVLNCVEFGRKDNCTPALKYKKSAINKKREICTQLGNLAVTKPGIQHFQGEVECFYPSLDLELDRQSTFFVDDEAKIRAELEREIEKDLEREIKRNISMLNQRLEELHALQARRYFKQGQKDSKYQKSVTLDEGRLKSISKLDDTTNTQVKKILPESFETWQKMPTAGVLKQNKTSQAEKKSTVLTHQGPIHSKVSPSSAKMGVHFSYASSPVTYWRKKPTAPTLSPSRLGWDSQTNDQPCNVSHSVTDAYNGNKSTKTPKASGEGLAKSFRNDKPKAQAQTKNLKPFQSWTSVASTKKFDWVRTLRSGVFSSPRISTTRPHLTSSSKHCGDLSSIKETFSGKTVRTLFPEDSLSTPSENVSKPHKTRTSSHIPIANLKYDQNSVLNGSHDNYPMAKVCSQEPASVAQKICRNPGFAHMTTKGRHLKTANSGRKCIIESSNVLKMQDSNDRKTDCMKESADQPETLNRMENPQEQSLEALEQEFRNVSGVSKPKEKSIHNGTKSSSNACAKERGPKNGSPTCHRKLLLEQESSSIQTIMCSSPLDQLSRRKTARLKVPKDKMAEKQQKLISDRLEKERKTLPRVKICRQTRNIDVDLDHIKPSSARLMGPRA